MELRKMGNNQRNKKKKKLPPFLVSDLGVCLSQTRVMNLDDPMHARSPSAIENHI